MPKYHLPVRMFVFLPVLARKLSAFINRSTFWRFTRKPCFSIQE